ncbi:MAG: glycosyltransferase family 4 protein, partial [Candidatus Binatia bacterium]
EWKGQLVLLEAFARLADSHPRSLALIVGGVHRSGSDYYERLRTFIDEDGLDERVLFTGPREDVADLMGCMDVVVHCSVRAEPFGRVIIEGMSVGRPVIATRAGGVPEFVRDGYNGLLVDPGNVAELVTALRRLFDDAQLRRELSRNSRRTAADFSIEKHSARVATVYDEVARRYHVDRGTEGESPDRSACPRR